MQLYLFCRKDNTLVRVPVCGKDVAYDFISVRGMMQLYLCIPKDNAFIPNLCGGGGGVMQLYLPV
jgi:hypothetical protein